MTWSGVLAARNIPRWLEVAGQLLAVTTVLLPLLGAVMRYVSFAVTPGVAMPFELAPATSLPELAGVALLGLAPSAVAAATYVVYFSIGVTLWRGIRRAWGTPAPSEDEDDQEDGGPGTLSHHRSVIGGLTRDLDRSQPEPTEGAKSESDVEAIRRLRRTWFGKVQEARKSWDEYRAAPTDSAEAPADQQSTGLGTYLTVGLVLVLALAGAGYLVISFLRAPVDEAPASVLWFIVFAGMTAAAIKFGWPTRSVSLFAAAWLLVIAAVSGLLYRGEIAAQFEMDPDSTSAPSGWYARVGERDGFLYLLPCPRGTSAVLAVRPEAIRTIQTSVSTRERVAVPSLLDLATGSGLGQLGLDPVCP